jgi:glycosyltransferase involved in cell wall biosynthesis
MLVPPDDAPALSRAVAMLEADRAFLARLSSAGRSLVREGYSIETTLDRLEAFLEVLCSAEAEPRLASFRV